MHVLSAPNRKSTATHTLLPDTRPVPLTLPTNQRCLRLFIVPTGQLTAWYDAALLELGRGNPTAGTVPTVDLTGHGPAAAGVSRRHARLARQRAGYYLEDLGSTNGTWLNQRALPVGQPVPVCDGDELRLGHLVVRVVLGDVCADGI
jgi:pSer/pThr/pTyr-binding forkhead associated (FHA) protein